MPDAPTPTYDADGQLLLGWLLVLRYDPADEAVVLSWQRDGDLFRKSLTGAAGYRPQDTPEILEGVRTTILSLTKPSLF